MAKFINFYENLKEALIRLNKTIVMYDGDPYMVQGISNHMKDGIFRAYLLPLDCEAGPAKSLGHLLSNYPTEHPTLGEAMDAWMASNPQAGLLRKHMNSPAFGKFRPFPLGMVNVAGCVYYLERQPQRHREQGLTRAMVSQTNISLSSQITNSEAGFYCVNFVDPAFKACVKATHPSPHECLKQLKDPDIENEGVAFHRNFALLRGPINTMYLAYKGDVVGLLSNGDFSQIKIAPDYKHTKEAIEELRLFRDIVL